MADLNRYRAARAKAGQPALRDDDRVAQLLVRMVEIISDFTDPHPPASTALRRAT